MVSSPRDPPNCLPPSFSTPIQWALVIHRRSTTGCKLQPGFSPLSPAGFARWTGPYSPLRPGRFQETVGRHSASRSRRFWAGTVSS
jgi:hypothetical protein